MLGSGSHRSRRLPAQFNRAAGANLDGAQVLFGYLLRPHNVGGDGEYDLIFPAFPIVLRKQVLQDRNPADPGIAAHRLGFCVLQNAAQQVYIAIGQPGFMLDPALANDGLRDPANGFRTV